MADETANENVNNDENANPPAGQDELASKSPEDLAAMIKDLRRENAAKRIRNREDEEKLKEFEEWKRSQMSEAEKLKADLDEARAARLSDWIDMFCEKYNVPDDSKDLVKGDSRETIERLAKALGEKSQKNTDSQNEDRGNRNSNINLFPGTRGSAVGSTGKNGTDFDNILRQQILGA